MPGPEWEKNEEKKAGKRETSGCCSKQQEIIQKADIILGADIVYDNAITGNYNYFNIAADIL